MIEGFWAGQLDVTGGTATVEAADAELHPSTGGYVLRPERMEEHERVTLVGTLLVTHTRDLEGLEDRESVVGVLTREDGDTRFVQTLADGHGAIVLTDQRAIGVVYAAPTGHSALAAAVDRDGAGTVLVFTVKRERLLGAERVDGRLRLGGAVDIVVQATEAFDAEGEALDHEDATLLTLAVAFTEPDPLELVRPDDCTQCGRDLMQDAVFCRFCGTKVELVELEVAQPAEKPGSGSEPDPEPAVEPDPEPEPGSEPEPETEADLESQSGPSRTDDRSSDWLPTCHSCGAGLNPDQRFCRACGAATQATAAEPESALSPSPSVEPRCPQCNEPHGPGQRFCRSCGTTL